MNILIWLLVGAVAGWLAGLIMKGGGFGLLWNIIIGIVGGFVGGGLLKLLNINFSLGNVYLTNIVVALIGAIILLFIIGLFWKRKS